MGCNNCANMYMHHGDHKCAKDPHDYETDEQKRIVEWLTRRDDPWVDPGCPGFKPFEVNND